MNINSAYNFLKIIQAKCNEVEQERNCLALQKLRLLSFAKEFKNHNEIMIKIGLVVESKVNTLLKQNMKILEISLTSALKAFEGDPNSYRYLLDKSKSNLALTDHKRNHIVKQRSSDYCHACYDRNSEQISLRYFDHLKKAIVSEIGFNTDSIM